MSLRWLVALTCLFACARVYATYRLGFGDAEALYATYALHPQVMYLDHPGLIGVVARWLGDGAAPSPYAAHAFTSIVATATPWIAVLAARGLGAMPANAPLAGLALIAAPEISIGLFGLTPDVLLAPMWLASLGLAGLGLRLDERDPRSIACLVASLGLAGISTSAKMPGLLLTAGLAIAFVRARPRSVGTWLGVLLAAITLSPLVRAELSSGVLMLRHRFVSTQSDAGLSLRNVGATIGGQLLYVSPVVAVAACVVLRWLRPGGLLFVVSVVTGVPLALLCLWSKVAEPHWLAPLWLAPALAFAVDPTCLSPRWQRWALGSGVALSTLVHLFVLTDLFPRLSGSGYDGRYDLANDMRTWDAALPAVRAVRAVEALRDGAPPPLVAPHWIIAAQLAAGLNDRQVSTTEAHDDFQRWLPRDAWRDGEAIVWVTDDRFTTPSPSDLRVRTTSLAVPIERGGRVVRTIRIEVWRRATPSTMR